MPPAFHLLAIRACPSDHAAGDILSDMGWKMSLAIEAIVGQYVKLGNLQALEKLRNHRQDLLSRLGDTAGYSFDLIRNTCQGELTAIDAAIEQALGDCRGHLDVYDSRKIAGWAQYFKHPSRRVTIGIYINRSLVTEVVADRFRGDLLKAGIGDGCHAFEFAPPEGSYRPPLKLGLRFGRKPVMRELNVA